MECSNLEISDIEIRACCSESRLAEGSLRSDSSGALNFLFLTATTLEGLQASCFGFEGKSALAAGEMISSSLKPSFMSRNTLAVKRRGISSGLRIVSGIIYPSGHTGLLILSTAS